MITEKYITKTREISINIVQTALESVRRKDIKKTGLRLYKDGFIGTSGALGNADDDRLFFMAEESLKNNIPYPHEVSHSCSEKLDLTSDLIQENSIVDEFDDMLYALRQAHQDISFSGKINIIENETSLINDSGLDLSHKDKYLSFDLGFKEKSSINIVDGGLTFKARKYERGGILNTINELCVVLKNPVDLPDKPKMPVVFLTSDTLPLLKFARDLSGQMFVGNSSLLSDKLGQRLFNKNFTLYQSTNPEDTTNPFFDAEGTINDDYRYALIEDGIVKTPYTDKKYSSLLNLPLTGSAVSEYDGVPSLGYLGYKVGESNKTVSELLGGAMGIFVVIAAGGDFTPDGTFGSPVQLAYLYDGERLIGRLPEFNISSHLFDMFGDAYIGVGKNTILPGSNDKCMVMELNLSK